MPPNEPVDLITFLSALLAIIAGKEVAALLGAYAGIFVAASAGAALSLSGNDKDMPPMRAVMYVSVRVIVGFVLTVPIARGLQNYLPGWGTSILVILVAFGIGFIRDYEALRGWLINTARRFAYRRIGETKRPDDDAR